MANKSVLFRPIGGMNTASSRQICYSTSEYLKKMGWKCGIDGKNNNPKGYKIVIFQKRYAENDLKLARKLRAKKVRVVLQLSEGLHTREMERNKILQFLKSTNALVVGTKRIHSWFKKRGIKSSIITTGLNLSILPKNVKKMKPFKICWIGAKKNERYLEVVANSLNELWKKHNFELRIIGAQLPKVNFAKKPEFIQWKLGEAERQVAECQIGIAPLFCNPYEQCKPPSKPVLYMALGLPVVATETPPYRELIQDGKNGFLVPNNNDRKWKESLEILLTDPAKRDIFAIRGKESCKPYSAENMARKWDKFLRKLL